MTEPLRVLVVDDDEVFRQQFCAFVDEEGHAVVGAPSIVRAIGELERRPFSVVFTDLRMPRHGGMELVREVARRWPHTLVVVVTGFATIGTAVEAMKIGAFDYVEKPFRPAEIRRVLTLASEELSFAGVGLPERDPWALAHELSRRDHRDILVIVCGPGTPGRVGPRVTTRHVAPPEPYRVLEAAREFLAERARGGIVLADATELLASRSPDEVASVVRHLKELTARRGPLAIGMNARRVSGDVLKVVREVLAAPVVHGVMEALGSPIRRNILRRLDAGAATFVDAMRAAGLDDSPKLSFHLRKLADEGLVGHTGDLYRLTDKGEEAMRALRRLEEAATAGKSDLIAFGTNPA